MTTLSQATDEREAKLAVLRAMLDRSIEAGGEVSETELDAALQAKAAELSKRPAP